MSTPASPKRANRPPTPGRTPRHFLRLRDRSPQGLYSIIDGALALKHEQTHGERRQSLAGRTLGMVMEKASTRTRVSFEVAMFQLGGLAIDLPFRDSQLSRGEPLKDTARVLSRYVDVIVLRTYSDQRLAEFAAYSTVPVINGLSDGGHPVQLLADLVTVQERLGPLGRQVVAFIGDCASNMARSWVEAAGLFGFELRLAAPAGYRPSAQELVEGAGRVAVHDDPRRAVAGATVVATDVWTSMGQEAEAEKRRRALAGFTIDHALMQAARPEAIVLHCLPAHRGEEITEQVIEGPQSAVFDEAENRLHAQKALLEDVLL